MDRKEKLELHCSKPLSPKEANTIRAVIPDDTYAEIKALCEKTGVSIAQMSRLLIEFALPYVEVIE